MMTSRIYEFGVDLYTEFRISKIFGYFSLRLTDFLENSLCSFPKFGITDMNVKLNSCSKVSSSWFD